MTPTPADPAADQLTPDDTRAMHIGEVAARTELSLRSLRHWDEVGLLRPSGRSDGGFRLYTEADVDKILLIRRMKPLGFTLEEMGVALRDIEAVIGASVEADGVEADGVAADGVDAGGVEVARERLAGVLQEAASRRARLEQQLSMADEFIDLLGRRLG